MASSVYSDGGQSSRALLRLDPSRGSRAVRGELGACPRVGSAPGGMSESERKCVCLRWRHSSFEHTHAASYAAKRRSPRAFLVMQRRRTGEGTCMMTARGVSLKCLCAQMVAGGSAAVQGDAYTRCGNCGGDGERARQDWRDLQGGRLEGVEEGGFAVDGGFGRERRFWWSVVGDTNVNTHRTHPVHWSDGRGETSCES